MDLSRQSKGFLSTFNNPDVSLYEYGQQWKRLGAVAFRGQKEICPTTGTPHYQCIAIFDKKKRGVKFVRHVKGHLIPANDLSSSWAYCSKEESRADPKEEETWGVPPRPNRNSKTSIAEYNKRVLEGNLNDMVDSGDIKLDNLDRVVSSIRTYRSLARPKLTDLLELDNYWIYGPPGTGKSWSARYEYAVGRVYTKAFNKWWDGYDDEETVLLDDFDGQEEYKARLAQLKQWADKYPFQAEFKGRQSLIRPKQIIVTANLSIDQIFDKLGTQQQMREALLRRFKSVHKSAIYRGPAGGDNRHLYVGSRQGFGAGGGAFKKPVAPQV